MIRTLTIAVWLGLTIPAHAQMADHPGTHGDDHAAHDMSDHSHSDHDHTSTAKQDHAMHDHSGLTLATTPELSQAFAAGGEPIVAKVLGVVCDFCAVAMNKTFGKRDEVAAVHVDLDTKTLNLVLKPGASLDDETVRSMVKKSGYKLDQIARGEALAQSS